MTPDFSPAAARELAERLGSAVRPTDMDCQSARLVLRAAASEVERKETENQQLRDAALELIEDNDEGEGILDETWQRFKSTFGVAASSEPEGEPA